MVNWGEAGFFSWPAVVVANAPCQSSQLLNMTLFTGLAPPR